MSVYHRIEMGRRRFRPGNENITKSLGYTVGGLKDAIENLDGESMLEEIIQHQADRQI